MFEAAESTWKGRRNLLICIFGGHLSNLKEQIAQLKLDNQRVDNDGTASQLSIGYGKLWCKNDLSLNKSV
jgi:hypothetical protein